MKKVFALVVVLLFVSRASADDRPEPESRSPSLLLNLYYVNNTSPSEVLPSETTSFETDPDKSWGPHDRAEILTREQLLSELAEIEGSGIIGQCYMEDERLTR